MKKLLITLCLALSSFNLGLGKSIDMENQVKFANMPLAELSVFADGGDKYAQHELGARYALFTRNKEITKEDKELAIKYYKLAAEQGYIPAMLRLGEYYRYGSLQRKRVPPPQEELEQAIYYFEMAAANNSNTALLNLGSIYKQLKDFDKALEYYNKAGNWATPAIAEIYQDENNPNKDDKKAFEALSKAYNNKTRDDFVYEKLAYCYLEGKGTQKDYNKAQEILLKYLTMAKEARRLRNHFAINEESAIVNLVALYFMHGKYEEGIEWLNINERFASTVVVADFLSYLYFTGKGVERDYEKVYEIQKNAKITTSDHYRKQKTPEFTKEVENFLKDTPSIEAYWEKVKTGDPSVENLSKFWALKTNRLGVDINVLKNIKAKIENGDNDSETKFQLARAYFREKNREEGFKWLRKSVAQGNPEAQSLLEDLEEYFSEQKEKQ